MRSLSDYSRYSGCCDDKSLAIENNLPRTRDVQMPEDTSRVRQRNAPRLLATLSKAVTGLLRRRG